MNNAHSLHELALPALSEDNPRDFLAALGLLRLIDLVLPELDACLHWNVQSGQPVISCCDALPENWPELLVAPLQELAAEKDQVLFHGPIIKTDSGSYREAVAMAINFNLSGHKLAKLPELLYASYAGQLVSENDGLVEPSAFSFGNGQGGKNLLKDVGELIQGMQPETFKACLSSQAKPISAKSLRWNPVEFRPAAYRSHDPGKKLKGDETLDYPDFNVLAFIGLTFFPSVPCAGGSETLGIFSKNRKSCFCWPVWSFPSRPDVVQNLANLPTCVAAKIPGVSRQWQSTRFSSDKSLYFAPAKLAY